MLISGGSYSGPREVHYLFVDGGTLRGKLRNVSDKFFGGVAFELNFRQLASGFTKVFFYDALPVRNEGEGEPEYEARIAPNRAVLDAAAAVDGIHVYEGDARYRRRRGWEQKKVDVMLTVDMLTHSFRRNMHKATLLTGDNDFKPLIDALVQEGMFVTLWYPTQETSTELMQAADARRALNLSVLRWLLTPATQELFRLPKTVTVPLGTEPDGEVLTQWTGNGMSCALYREGNEFVATQQRSPTDRLHVRDANYDLLRTHCSEAFELNLPPEP